MLTCSRWENLYNKALKDGNELKALEFKEKLVECIVYTLQHLVAEKEIDEAERLMEYGREVAKKYGISELSFHLDLIQAEINRIREVWMSQSSGSGRQ